MSDRIVPGNPKPLTNADLLAASLEIHEDDDELFEIVDGPAFGGFARITSGTAAPSGGSDGDIYLQYTI